MDDFVLSVYPNMANLVNFFIACTIGFNIGNVYVNIHLYYFSLISAIPSFIDVIGLVNKFSPAI